jgi:glycosyltransferase involved in cell wall biosynthesis
VGNAYPHKNLEKLIGAFEALINNNKDLELVLVGEMDYFYQRLKKYVREKFSQLVSKVIFTDFVSDEELVVLYGNSAIYVFPSLCEGFGLPPLEAMVHGVPVVSSRSTCLPEVLGEAAVYFDATSPQDMAEKINKVLSDESSRQKLIAAGYEQIKKYSWEKMAEETLKIYS